MVRPVGPFTKVKILKADWSHPRNYLHMPLIIDTQTNTLDWWWLLLLFTVQPWEVGQTDGRTDGHYQVHYLPRFADDKNRVDGNEWWVTNRFERLLIYFGYHISNCCRDIEGVQMNEIMQFISFYFIFNVSCPDMKCKSDVYILWANVIDVRG